MNFGLIFCTVVDPIIVYIKIFCVDFFETLKYHFRFFLENGLHGARAPLELFVCIFIQQLANCVWVVQKLVWYVQN
jgi:hypothetical protein